MSRRIKKGSTDRSAYIRVLDSTTFLPETGFAYNTPGIDLWYRRQGGAKVSITEATLATVDVAHSDGGVIHIADGYVRVDLPDAAVATGAKEVLVGGTATDMVIQGELIQLVDVDDDDTVRMGLTALPNAVVNTAGGLTGIISHAGTAQSGGTDKIRLAASGSSSTNDFYNGQLVYVISGTGAGQCRLIVDYVGADKDAFVYVAGASNEGMAWATAPDNTSVYVVVPVVGFLPGSIAVTGQNPLVELTAGALADIAQEISDALTVDTYAEPASVPAATASLKDKIGWLALKARNKITQTATTQTVFADDGSTTVATSTVSDSSGTATRGEYS